jgi:hypothetical protein
VHEAQLAAEQVCSLKLPKSVPSLQLRFWLVQLEPHGTVAVENAVTDELCASVPPHGKLQLLHTAAVQFPFV